MTIDKEKLQKLQDEFYSKAKYKKFEWNFSDICEMSPLVDTIYYIDTLLTNSFQDELSKEVK